MPDPITFTSATPRLALPLLFAGQAQKEFYVNQAHALIDALLHAAIEGEADDPPVAPAEGECWLAGSAPTAAWDGHPGELACYEAGVWIFVTPRDGIRLLNRSSGQLMLFRGTWSAPAAPAAPAGGTTIDSEARTAITDLIAALSAAGVLPA